jgi:hypothetical protein
MKVLDKQNLWPSMMEGPARVNQIGWLGIQPISKPPGWHGERQTKVSTGPGHRAGWELLSKGIWRM